MNRQTYITPEIEVVEIDYQSMMVAGSNEEVDTEIEITDDEYADPDLEVLTNKRRGEWGNLWKEV